MDINKKSVANMEEEVIVLGLILREQVRCRMLEGGRDDGRSEGRKRKGTLSENRLGLLKYILMIYLIFYKLNV